MEQQEEETKRPKFVSSDPRGWVDRTVGKAISRKMTVFLVGTVFFAAGMGLASEDWMTLAIAYVGTQGFIDAIVAFRASS